MIYTLTMNPSIDYVMEMEELTVGKMNRSDTTYVLPGGKGINVSTVLNHLQVANIAILPVSGFTGEKLLAMLSERGISYEALNLSEGNTRINVKVLCQAETELNAKGPDLNAGEEEQLFDKLQALKKGDYLVLSGSVPANLGNRFYAKIMEKLKDKELKIVLDTTGEQFLNALKYKPFLVKPNKEELEEITGKKGDTKEDVSDMAKTVQAMGARNVLVSMGSEGGLLLTEKGQTFYKKAPNGQVINTVGAGDSMVAGFLAGYLESENMEKAFYRGIAAGSASAFSKNLATKEEIDALTEIL